MKKCLILAIFIFQISVAYPGEVQWIKPGIFNWWGDIEKGNSELSPDGKLFAIAGIAQNFGIKVIDVNTGLLVTQIPTDWGASTIRAPYEKAFDFSLDSKLIYYCEISNNKTISKIFSIDIMSGEKQSIYSLNGYIVSLFSLLDNKLLIRVGNNQLILLDLNTNTEIANKTIPDMNHFQDGYIVLTSNKSDRIAVPTNNKEQLRIFDTKILSEINTWNLTLPYPPEKIYISPLGKYIICRTTKPTLEVYNAENGEHIKTIAESSMGFYSGLKRIGFINNDETIIYSSSSGMKVIKMSSSQPEKVIPYYVKDPTSIIPVDDKRVIQYDDFSSLATVVNIETGENEMYLNNIKGIIRCLGFSYDNKYIGVFEQPDNVSTFYPYFKLLSIENGELKADFPIYKHLHPSEFYKSWISMSPIKHEFITSDANKDLIIYNYLNGIEINELYGHKSGIVSGYYSADGSVFLSWDEDDNIKLWDLNTYKEAFDYQHHSKVIWANFTANKDEILLVQGVEIQSPHLNSLSLAILNTKTKEITRESNENLLGSATGRLSEKNRFSLSSDNKYLVWAARRNTSQKPNIIDISDFSNKSPIVRNDQNIEYDLINEVMFSPNNDYFIAATANDLHYIDLDGRILNTKIKAFPEQIEQFYDYISHAFSNDGKYFTASKALNLILFNALQHTSVQDDITYTLNDIHLYPNPATEHINIEITNDEEVISVNVYNLLGELVWQSNNFVYSKNIYIPVKELSSGMYLFKLTTTKQTYSKYFVKHK